MHEAEWAMRASKETKASHKVDVVSTLGSLTFARSQESACHPKYSPLAPTCCAYRK